MNIAVNGALSNFGLGIGITLHKITKGGTRVLLDQKAAYIGAKSLSTKLGITGLAVTGYDIYDQGLNTSRSLDVIMGGVAFIPGVGWVASGTYFIGNLITIGITGQSIGDHIQEAISGEKGDESWRPWD